MTCLFQNGETITAKLDDRQRLVSFTWQAQIRIVERIQQHWQVDTEWWSSEGRVYREYFTVTTADGLLCTIYQDFLDEQWYIERVYD